MGKYLRILRQIVCTLAIATYLFLIMFRIYKQFSAEQYCMIYVDLHTRTCYFTAEDG